MSTDSRPPYGDPAAPHRTGRFGDYGGRFVPEALVAALDSWTRSGSRPPSTPRSRASSTGCTAPTPAGRACSPRCPRFAQHAGGARILLKREDLNHTGSHKINNVLGQALLTKRMGKTRIIAETGAGQHGVASATAAALLGLDCVVYMGEKDTRRQALNVARMRLLGAEVIPVSNGSATLKDAINEAMRDWVTNVDTHALPHRHGHRPPPVPRDGARLPPDHRCRGPRPGARPGRPAARRRVACVGGGSNAMGIFHRFIDDARCA